MSANMRMDAPLRHVGIWIRVSTEDQAMGDSPKHHEARARAYAEAKGWTVREVYDLAGVSGKAVIEHPVAKQMMADVKRGHITGLIFSKLARLARNTRELLDFSDHFRAHDAALVSLQESIDTSSPAGRLFYTMIAAMAQWEREEIVDRINASVVIRAKLGKPLSGRVPYGYQWKDGKVQVHPDEAPVRRLAYELFDLHKRLVTVSRMLNEKGHRARKGPFTATTVCRLIQDPSAKGLHRTNYTRNLGGNKKWAVKPEHEWVVNPVEPIVTEELWDRCNRLLDERKTRGARPGKKPVHPFAGRIFCGCGTKMYVPSGTPKYVCYDCRRKIPITDMDALFREQLKEYFVSSDNIAAYLKGLNDAASNRRDMVATLHNEEAKTKQEIESTYALYHSGGLTVEQFKERFQPLDARLKQIADEIPRAEAQADVLKIQEVSGEEILSEAHSMYERWPGMTPEEKFALIETCLEKVELLDDEVRIQLCYVPSSEKIPQNARMLRGSSPPRA